MKWSSYGQTLKVREKDKREEEYSIPGDLIHFEYEDGEPLAHFKNFRKERFVLNPHDLENGEQAWAELEKAYSNKAVGCEFRDAPLLGIHHLDVIKKMK